MCRNSSKAASVNGKAFDPWVESSLGGLCFESSELDGPLGFLFGFCPGIAKGGDL